MKVDAQTLFHPPWKAKGRGRKARESKGRGRKARESKGRGRKARESKGRGRKEREGKGRGGKEREGKRRNFSAATFPPAHFVILQFFLRLRHLSLSSPIKATSPSFLDKTVNTNPLSIHTLNFTKTNYSPLSHPAQINQLKSISSKQRKTKKPHNFSSWHSLVTTPLSTILLDTMSPSNKSSRKCLMTFSAMTATMAPPATQDEGHPAPN